MNKPIQCTKCKSFRVVYKRMVNTDNGLAEVYRCINCGDEFEGYVLEPNGVVVDDEDYYGSMS